jgi:hypothetical protein
LWLDKCRKEKKWLDDDGLNPFCLEDQDQFSDVKRRTLSVNPSPPIFQGLTFYRHESFAMPCEELKVLIECAGGSMMVHKQLKEGEDR